MTCREKLKNERPEMIREDSIGGATGCPSDYEYLDDPVQDEYGCSLTCRECWDREIPAETKTIDNHPAENSTPTCSVEDQTEETEGHNYIDPIHITIHTNHINSFSEVISEVFKYVYSIKDRTVNINIQ